MKGVMAHRAFLRGLPLLSGFDESELDALIGVLGAKEIREGEELYRETDAGDALYIVREGAFEVGLVRGPRTHRLAMLTEGQVFGHVELLDGKPRFATVRALQPSKVLALARTDFDALISAADGTASKLLELLSKMLAAQLRAGNERLGHLATQEHLAARPRAVHDPEVQREVQGVAAAVHGFSLDDIDLMNVEVVVSDADRYRNYRQR